MRGDSMGENNTTVSGGITFTEMLQVAFIVLKLMHVINWKWIWVLAPTWISFLVSIVIILIFYLIYRRF